VTRAKPRLRCDALGGRHLFGCRCISVGRFVAIEAFLPNRAEQTPHTRLWRSFQLVENPFRYVPSTGSELTNPGAVRERRDDEQSHALL